MQGTQFLAAPVAAALSTTAALERRNQSPNTLDWTGRSPYANMIKLTFHTASVAQLPDILEPNSIDVILTDPPYEREFLPV